MIPPIGLRVKPLRRGGTPIIFSLERIPFGLKVAFSRGEVAAGITVSKS
jgi:hypothetical protein